MAPPDAAPPDPKPKKEDEPRTFNLAEGQACRALVEEGNDSDIRRNVYRYISERKAASPELQDYLVLFLIEPKDDLTEFHANTLYEEASNNQRKQDILLVLQSGGGKVEPAYLISKTCKNLSKEKFVVAVPRQAKSAATLLALGADEIHMGLMSELGPIDPQISGLPALGLANALTRINQLVAEAPKSSQMWAEYLTNNLSLYHLGYYERLCESAVQYAQRLLKGKSLPQSWTAEGLANQFVFHYKDHRFVIDLDEATQLLGPKVVKINTAEYRFANDVFKALDSLDFYLRIYKQKELWHVGSERRGFVVRSVKTKTASGGTGTRSDS